MVTTKTPIDSIEIPTEYIELCELWNSGLNCMLYAVSSTGGLTLGNRRPSGCDTEEKWYLQLWLELSCDVAYAARLAMKPEHEDHATLIGFEIWVDKIIERLSEEYGLEDWEN